MASTPELRRVAILGSTGSIGQSALAVVDGSIAAHFEHSIAITESGPEILTTV